MGAFKINRTLSSSYNPAYNMIATSRLHSYNLIDRVLTNYKYSERNKSEVYDTIPYIFLSYCVVVVTCRFTLDYTTKATIFKIRQNTHGCQLPIYEIACLDHYFFLSIKFYIRLVQFAELSKLYQSYVKLQLHAFSQSCVLMLKARKSVLLNFFKQSFLFRVK